MTNLKNRKIIDGYDRDKISIGTIGSHSALNILKGAKEEGFRTLCIVKKSDEIVYRRFPVTDEIIYVGIGTSPYAYLKYGDGMYMGRRIAREIKEALKKDQLENVLT